MKIAAVQHDIVWEDPQANFERLAPMIKEAANEGAELIALTEMFSWGFSMKTDRVHEPVDGPSTQFLVEQAAASGAWVCGSLPERPEGADLPFNQLVVASPDGDVHRYAKIYPFSFAGENEHYQSGDRTLTLEIGGLRVSFFVCYDLRFADEFWKLALDTDLYVVVANWPESRREHWKALLRARAIENQAYMMATNRVGSGGRPPGKLPYAGDASIIDPLGEILQHAEFEETTIMADVHADRVQEVRTRFPFLNDRR